MDGHRRLVAVPLALQSLWLVKPIVGPDVIVNVSTLGVLLLNTSTVPSKLRRPPCMIPFSVAVLPVIGPAVNVRLQFIVWVKVPSALTV